MALMGLKALYLFYPTAPEYRETSPISVRATGNVIIVDWSNSFFINGEVTSFSLFSNSELVYQGFATSYRVSWESVYKGKAMIIMLF